MRTRKLTYVLAAGVLAAVQIQAAAGSAQAATAAKFTLSASPATVSLTPGGSAKVTVKAVRAKGFTAPITLAVSGAPAGVTVAGQTVAAKATSAAITITTAASAAAGSATLTVKGTSGTANATTTVKLTLIASATTKGAAAAASTGSFDATAAVSKQLSSIPEGFSGVKPEVLKDQLAAAKPFLVDLREPSEIATGGYIDGAVKISIRELAKNLDKLPAQNMPIVLICQSGHRGGIGLSMLQILGYTNVKAMTGGMNAWVKAGFPVVKGEPPAPTAGTAPKVDAAAVAAINTYLSAIPEGYGTLQAPAMKDQLSATNPYILDVRETSEVSAVGSILGAVNVPTRQVPTKLSGIPKDRPIIVVCASGHRGAIVMADLQLLGYKNVKSLAGGMNAWVAAGFNVIK